MSARAPGHRADLEGLRAFAVGMVVVYHVWLGRVSGGVDVFLVMSAYFLTASLLHRLERGDPVDVVGRWARTFRRLVPAAAVAVAGTAVAALLVLPATRHRTVLTDTVASLTYTENWLLAHRAVDYYAPDKGAASPLQHMWSLSVQGQVFLVWPLLLAVVALALRGLRRRGVVVAPHVAVGAALGVVLVASFAYAVHATSAGQAVAYFDTRARLWEFAAGGLLAVVATRVRLPAALAVPLGWAGVLAMLACGLVLDVTRSFPGWAAWWPVLGAGAVVLAGTVSSRVGVGALLARRPLVALGGVSYALYLVHWPVLVLWLAVAGRPRAGVLDGAVVVAASLVLAWLLAALVDRPVRRLGPSWSSPVRSAGLVLATAGVVASVAGVGILRIDAQARSAEQVAAGEPVTRYPGARVTTGDGTPVLAADERLPPATALRGEFASLPQRCAGRWADPALGSTCSVLDPGDAATATVVVVGDSHAEQWLQALRPLADAHGWRLVAVLEGGCSYGLSDTRASWCRDHNAAAREYVHRVRPDLVVTVATAAHRRTAQERLVDGYEEAVRDLTGQGIPVLGLRDNPRFPSGVVACALERGDAACTAPVTDKLAARDPARVLSAVPGWAGVDLTDRICPDGSCPPAVGNVWVYLDDNHLTKTFAGTLAPTLEERMRAAGAWPTGAAAPPPTLGG